MKGKSKEINQKKCFIWNDDDNVLRIRVVLNLILHLK